MRKMISTTVHTLTETEVNPVMNKLLQSGIEITALHNHLMRAMPVTRHPGVSQRSARPSR